LLAISIILLGIIAIVAYKVYKTKVDAEVDQIYDAVAKEKNILEEEVKKDL